MNTDQIEGNWTQIIAKARLEWADLTDDDMQRATAGREALEGVLQERFGDTKEAARDKVDEFIANL